MWAGPVIKGFAASQNEFNVRVADSTEANAHALEAVTTVQAKMSETQARIAEQLADIGRQSIHLVEIHADPRSKFSTARTNRAISHTAQMTAQAFESLGVEPEKLQPYLIKIDEALHGISVRQQEMFQ